ncbi:hypothetical protein [Guggenheimella bovis]
MEIIFAVVFICLIYIAIEEHQRRKKYGKPITVEQYRKMMETDPYEIVKTKIIDTSHTSSDQVSTGSAVGRAVIGGALFGDIGAIVGASTAKRKVKEHHTTTFMVYYDNGMTQHKTVENGSKLYEKFMAKLEV